MGNEAISVLRTCKQCGGSMHRRSVQAHFCHVCIVKRNEERNRLFDKAEAAYRVMRCAIRYGFLPDPKTLACADCGSVASRYDHRDYAKPLDVDAVCAACNNKRGRAIGSCEPFLHHIWPELAEAKEA